MPSKLIKVSQLAESATLSLTSELQNWLGFLQTAGTIYKYPFEDQVLIHAQRPDATACASMELWNGKMHRWVKKGSRGIALIDHSSADIKLRYVFDVSDTVGHSRNAPKLWELREEHHADIIEAVNFTYFDGDQIPFEDAGQAICPAILAIVNDNLPDYFEDLKKNIAETVLEMLPEEKLESEFRRLVEASTAYTVFARCKLDSSIYLSENELEGVAIFNTVETISQLGSAVSDCSEIALRQIETVIRDYERERSEKDELSLQTSGRLPDTRPSAGRAATSEDRQIRAAAQEVFAESPARDIQRDGITPDIASAPVGYRSASESDAGTGAAEIDENPPAAADGQHDGTDAAPKQDSSPSRGSGTGGSNLQLNLFATEAEQIERIEAEETTSAFAISQEDIDNLLLRGSGFSQGATRIYAYFKEPHTNDERVKFLRNEYGIGGGTRTFTDGTSGWENHDGKGISLTKGSLINPDASVLLNWNSVQKRIMELIALGRYKTELPYLHFPNRSADTRFLTYTEGSYFQYEKKTYEITEINEAEKVIRAKGYDDKKLSVNLTYDEFKRVVCGDREPIEQTAFEYSIGDTVYLESERSFRIENIDTEEDEIKLRDLSMPLISRTISIDEFETLLNKNPRNNILPRKESAEKQYDLGFGNLGNGTTVWNRLEETDGDYKTVAHIGDDGDVVLYEEMPAEAVEQINRMAESEKQRNIDEAQKITGEPTLSPIAEPAHNFKITDEKLGEGTATEKVQRNVEAIKTLLQVESENRNATPDEQDVLSKYVGWGGLPQIFDNDSKQFTSYRQELKELLTESEYASARATTLNAHYTSPTIIKAIYKAAENMGFRRGNILEPACGIGNFLGLLPDGMAESKLYGVELDSITGRIAKQLYPESNIQVTGFETSNLPDSFFDMAIGNVPFGSYRVPDKKYDKLGFAIHDYFFAKTIDKVRPGGIVAFVTSKGTMDKQNNEVRKYIAQRAELLGAIRLPNVAFKANAGTEVTSDILFLKKRERPIEVDEPWIHLGQTEDGVPLNSYFADHPEMMLGRMSFENTMYGNAKDTTCTPADDWQERLQIAVEQFTGGYELPELDEIEDELESDAIPADPDVRNFSFTEQDGRIYYRIDSQMHPAVLNKTAESRVRGMMKLRDATRELVELQLTDAPDNQITAAQQSLNSLYDDYVSKYGRLFSRGNSMAFSEDSSYPLLCSLEVLDEEGEFKAKADMFTKRTIRQHIQAQSVETPAEALAVCLNERDHVDIEFMANLCGKTADEVVSALDGQLYLNPHGGWETADEYLSGDVKKKLKSAKDAAAQNVMYTKNVEALQAALPVDLDASEITVRLGTTWIPDSDITDFLHEVMHLPYYQRDNIKVIYTPATATWYISSKSSARSVQVNETFGTTRLNGVKLLELCLNLRNAKIFDTITEDGQEKRVFNRKETMLAQQKQESIRAAFKDWIFRDAERRERLVTYYNDNFNNIVPRVYDGAHLTFPGMNPEIKLGDHQKNGVARIIYGGNSLLAHVVGAGKTFTMIAAAMKLKHMGISFKPLMVVPSHLTEQWAGEILRLYPSANVLTSTKKDFERAHRRRFCSRIATGDYDIVVIGHSQFERIPISAERQKAMIDEQIAGIQEGIADLKEQRAERYSIKQMELLKKSLEFKLQKLSAEGIKDNVINFEELGVDRLMVDESHSFKNLFMYSKMRNVAGISQTDAQKSSDMFMKCRYLDELTDAKGIVFASGTPISNSMAEMYTVQRYLQYDLLKDKGLTHFDAWAAQFGETVTAIELTPEGTGYRQKTRFARFYNLPELMQMYWQVADIQTAEMLNLPIPRLKDGKFTDIALPPSELQKEAVQELSKRADAVRKGAVDPSVDNMLKITNDGRKLALDQRLLNPLLPDNPVSKANVSLENAIRIYEENAADKRTQLIFCDLSVPKADAFNVYDDIRSKLIARGVPEDEVRFIHEANSDAQKAELFAKVRSGEVRFLLGSTFKMGAGTNVQAKLKAVHHLDVPWRPSDLEQRNGRILRQGNTNDEVEIFRYVTEGTFDAYSYQLLEQKQRFISQVFTGKTVARSMDDIDTSALSYAEIKALAAGDPRIKERMDLEGQVERLKLLKNAYNQQKYRLEDSLRRGLPEALAIYTQQVEAFKEDIQIAKANEIPNSDAFKITIDGTEYTKKEYAGMLLLKRCTEQIAASSGESIGQYRGFEMHVSHSFNETFILLKRNAEHSVTLGTDPIGNITRMDNQLDSLPDKLNTILTKIEEIKSNMKQAELELEKPFYYEQDLKEKSERLSELTIQLEIEEHGGETYCDMGEADDEPEQRKQKTVAR